MAWRLGEYVVYGEIRNTSRYATRGVIVLRGEQPGGETHLHLDLCGDCGPDLHGKFIRFRPGREDEGKDFFRLEDYPRLRDRQIGPTGTMTAQGWVRTLPCSVEEFMRRTKLGEPPPTAWESRLYLEWYGQNGRVVIEMAGAVVEECVRAPVDDNDEGLWEPIPNLALPPGLGEEKPAGPEITVIRRQGDQVHTEREEPSDADEENGAAIPDALQRQLDAEADAVERAIRGEGETTEAADPGDAAVRELEMMDHCLEHGEMRSISSLLGGADEWRPPEDMDDEEVEGTLKGLLALLAPLGIALDVCEHFSPRDCYRLLRDEILPEPNAYAELAGTSWVQHFSTYEYCADCEAAAGKD